MDKEKHNKLIDSVAYIIWSLSLWMLSYYQLLRCEFQGIKEGYVKALYFWVVSAVILYGNSKSELTHEIFKSCFILVGSSIFDALYNSKGTFDTFIKHLIVFLVYQALGYMVIAFLSYSKKLHGRYAKRIALLHLSILGITYLLFKWNLYISLILAVIINLIIGYRYYLFNGEEQKLEEKKIEQERKKVEEDRKNVEDLKKAYKKCQEKILDLESKNKKLQDKVRIYENKKRRNKRNKRRSKYL